jgi:anti-sigma28 factor (negative regulator of flagellin synthesis)
MVVVVPATEGLILPDSQNRVANESPSLRQSSRARRERLIELRNAIASGEYRVSAANLADALLRSARSAN